MRATIVVAALLISAAPAFAQPTGRDPLPHNEAALQQLNLEQLRVVRRASRMCALEPLPVPIKAERNPCVIASTDKAIADSDDSALQAFHAALPANDRYDEYRADTAWRDLLVGDHD